MLIDTEKAVLAILLRRGGGQELCALKSEYFLNNACRKIYETMKMLYLEKGAIDVAMLGEKLKNGSAVIKLYEYSDLFLNTQQELEEYIEKLKRKYYKAQVKAVLETALNDIGEKGTNEVTTFVLDKLSNLTIEDDKARYKTFGDALIKTTEWLEKQYKLQQEEKLLATHLPDLNDIIGGLMPQDLILIGARPSVGKTAIAMDIAKHIAAKNKRVLFVTLEMSIEALCVRYIAGYTEINSQKIRTGKLNDKEWDKISKAVWGMNDITLFIDDVSRTVTDIKISAKEIKAHGGLDLIVIDYMQLLQPEGRYDTREQEVASISRSLKALARELDIPIIVLAQLNREAEGRKPALGFLRESGAQEQDADIIIFLWEPPKEQLDDNWARIKEKINEKGNRLLEIIVAKHRNGPTGAFYVCYVPSKTMFMCLPKGGDDYGLA